MMYEEETLQLVYSRMVDSIEILAAEANEQIMKLKGCVVTDEIALSFHDEVRLSSEILLEHGKITEQQYKKILEIDNKFDKMSDNKDLWTNEQLRISGIWEECRQKGRALLRELD